MSRAEIGASRKKVERLLAKTRSKVAVLRLTIDNTHLSISKNCRERGALTNLDSHERPFSGA